MCTVRSVVWWTVSLQVDGGVETCQTNHMCSRSALFNSGPQIAKNFQISLPFHIFSITTVFDDSLDWQFLEGLTSSYPSPDLSNNPSLFDFFEIHVVSSAADWPHSSLLDWQPLWCLQRSLLLPSHSNLDVDRVVGICISSLFCFWPLHWFLPVLGADVSYETFRLFFIETVDEMNHRLK